MAAEDESKRKSAIVVFSIALLALILYPIHRNLDERPEDDFPLTHYPMFSVARGKTIPVTHMFDVDYSGVRHLIPYDIVAPGGFNQLRKQIRGMASTPEGAKNLCEHVAKQLLIIQSDRKIAEVHVVTGEYVLEAYYEGRIEVDKEKLLHRCKAGWSDGATTPQPGQPEQPG